MYDTIIVGAGPAGVAAGIYASRKKMRSLLITLDFGGQSIVSDKIENWVGSQKISGFELAKNLEDHLRAQKEIEIKIPEKALEIKEKNGGFLVITDKDEYQSKTLILANGARRRKLNIPGEKEFDGKGVVYCSTCDAPLFAAKSVAVIGGGNAGLEAIEDLIPYAKDIYLFIRGEKISGDVITFEGIKKSDKLKQIILNSQVTQIIGDKFVTGLKYRTKHTVQDKTLSVQGIFVEIGAVPNSEIVKDLVAINQSGEIIIDHRTGATSRPGIYAAGDVTDEKYKQNNISAGDGVKAALSAYNYLAGRK